MRPAIDDVDNGLTGSQTAGTEGELSEAQVNPGPEWANKSQAGPRRQGLLGES